MDEEQTSPQIDETIRKRNELRRQLDDSAKPKAGTPEYQRWYKGRRSVIKAVKEGERAFAMALDVPFSIGNGMLSSRDAEMAELYAKGYSNLQSLALSPSEVGMAKALLTNYVRTYYPDWLVAIPPWVGLAVFGVSLAMPRVSAFSLLKQLKADGKTVADLPVNDAGIAARENRTVMASAEPATMVDVNQMTIFDAPTTNDEDEDRARKDRKNARDRARRAARKTAKGKLRIKSQGGDDE